MFLFSGLMSCSQPGNKGVFSVVSESEQSAESGKTSENQADSALGDPNKVKNIILLIGDGMGFPALETAEIYTGQPSEVLNSDITGSLTTYSADNEITDSAAAATALACGIKTNNSVIGLDTKGNSVQNLCELARKMGRKIGIVTTDELTGATPACFSAHASARSEYEKIAIAQLEFRPEVLFGGEDVNYTADRILQSGYKTVKTKTQLKELSKNDAFALGQFDNFELEYYSGQNDAPTLLDMADKALELLDNPNGFFLMIEEAHIDRAGHGNNLVVLVDHVIQINALVAMLKEYIKKNPDTLLVVTADHETGGITLSEGMENEDLSNRIFTTTNHTAADVPLSAFGKKRELFFGKLDNTDIAEKLAEMLKADVNR